MFWKKIANVLVNATGVPIKLIGDDKDTVINDVKNFLEILDEIYNMRQGFFKDNIQEMTRQHDDIILNSLRKG